MFHMEVVNLFNLFSAGWCLAFFWVYVCQKRKFSALVAIVLLVLNLWFAFRNQVVIKVNNIPTIEIRRK